MDEQHAMLIRWVSTKNYDEKQSTTDWKLLGKGTTETP